MKSSKISKVLIASYIIALSVFQSMAGTPQETFYVFGGTGIQFTLSAGPGTSLNNPNGFNVAMVRLTDSGKCFGFLLDGSEASKTWLKTFQDAALNGQTIEVIDDDNVSNGYGLSAGSGYYPTGKLVYVALRSAH